MDAAVVKCLELAELYNIKSISFPAIGTGNLGMDAKECAKFLLESVAKFSRQNPQFIELVRITIFQQYMVEAFRTVMKMKSGETSTSEPGVFFKAARKFARYLPFGLGGDDETNPTEGLPKSPIKISLEVFAGTITDVDGAIKAISEMMNEHCKQKIIENEAINMLSEEQLRIIHTAEARFGTKVDIEKRVGRIEIRGRSEDILEVASQVQEIIYTIKEDERKRYQAEIVAKDIEWEYKDGEKFEKYPKDINLAIETAFAEQKQQVIFSFGDSLHIIDFAKKKETCMKRRLVSDVRRRDVKAFAVPGHWDVQPTDSKGVEKEVHLVKLHPNATEYQRVEQHFHSQTRGLTINSIERVQNPGLNGVYETKKAKMDEGKSSNEMRLFHGTAGINVADINAKGFNRSYAGGANAAMYGNGVYFAVHASYSARSTFSPPDPATGLRYIYLAKVLVGEYTIGKKGLIVPPSKNDPNNPTDSFDTVVDQNPNPNIVVTFYDWQCYPEYLITFQ